MAKDKKAKRKPMLTGKVRLSYPHLFSPQDMQGKKTFSFTGLVPKDEMTTVTNKDGEEEEIPTIKLYRRELLKAKKEKWGPDKENWPEDMQSPIKDGDNAKFADNKGYAGHWVIQFACPEDSPPELYDERNKPLVKASDLYPGCYVRALVSTYAWEFPKPPKKAYKFGVSFSLHAVQKMDDGESFGTRVSAKNYFAPIDGAEGDEDGDEDTEEEDF